VSDLDAKALAAATHELRNAAWPGAIEAAIRTYIAHVAASPADLRAVLAYDAGLAEGRRQGLEEAANSLDMSRQTIRLNAGELSASEMRAVKAVLVWKAAAIRALIKEPTT